MAALLPRQSSSAPTAYRQLEGEEEFNGVQARAGGGAWKDDDDDEEHKEEAVRLTLADLGDAELERTGPRDPLHRPLLVLLGVVGLVGAVALILAVVAPFTPQSWRTEIMMVGQDEQAP
ncbi:hypothetical protein JCM1840_006136 [Sporobolomyces johnsonii]